MDNPLKLDLADLWAFDCSGSIKAIDDDGRFEGLAVPFGDPDLSRFRDRFTAETDFGRAMKSGADLLYFHGLPTIGDEPNPLADSAIGDAEFKTTDAGLWMTGQIRRRNDYEIKVFEMVQAGKLGLSTGTASHRVRRSKNADGTHTIKSWPIDEVSLTPTPAHPRTSVYSIKSLLAGGNPLGDDVPNSVVMGGLSALGDAARYRIGDHLRDAEMSRDDKLAACKGCLDEHAAVGHRLIAAMLGPDPDPAAVKSLVEGFGSGASPETFLESCLKSASDIEGIASRFAKIGPAKLHAIKTLRDALDALVRRAGPEPEKVREAIETMTRLKARYEV